METEVETLQKRIDQLEARNQKLSSGQKLDLIKSFGIALTAITGVFGAALWLVITSQAKEIARISSAKEAAELVVNDTEFKAEMSQKTFSGLPKIILAFAGECPSGWETFREGTGRFLVGAGSDPKFNKWKQVQPNGSTVEKDISPYKLMEPGGEETHILSKGEMPKHNHGGIYGSDGSKPRATNDHRRETAHNTKQITAEGGNLPHNNIPPYIAVSFCTPK